MTADLTKLVTLILGISLSSDRLVTLLKSIFPQLAAPPASAGDEPANTWQEITKKVSLMVFAFFCSFITALLFPECKDGIFNMGILGNVPAWFIGLLASAGSAFWTNILGYLSSLKDLKIQQAFAIKNNTKAQLTGNNDGYPNRPRNFSRALTTGVKSATSKTVRFTATFSGGPGSIKVKILGVTSFDLTKNEFKDIDLEPGNYDYSIAGSAATGQGAACSLTLSGDIISDSPHNFGQGQITPNQHPLLVKD